MLDRFFQKYTWTAHAALIFLAAWLSAKTVNTVVGAVIRPKPQLDLSNLPSTAPRAPAPPVSLDTTRLYALIGRKPPPPPAAPAQSEDVAAPPAPPETCHDPRAAPAKSSLRAQLIAGVVAEKPQWSIASITDLSSRETRIYGVGESVQGARLLSVERIRDEHDATGRAFKVVAIVCNNGQKEYLDFDAEGGAVAAVNIGTYPPPGRPSATAPARPAVPGIAGVEGIKKVAENRYEVPKTVIDNTLSNLNSVATQARIVPSFKNGVANGFKLFSIQPGSLYSSLGIQNGDVIQRINGYEINSPDKALEIYQRLKETPHITIELERNGQTIKTEYNVAQ